VSLTLGDLGDAVDSDPTWLPWTERLEIIDKQRHLAMACHNIFVFACGLKLVTSNVEARAIELEAYGINGWLFIVIYGGNPGKGLRTYESQFLF
jgi:hypothetical protein